MHSVLHRHVLALFLASSGGGLAHAATLHWNNPAGGNWNVPGNWAPAQIPTATDDVVIDLPGTYIVSVNVAASAANLTIGAGAGTPTLAMKSNTILTLKGDGTATADAVIELGPGGLSISAGKTLTVEGVMNWNGDANQGISGIDGTGKLLIATGATLNIVGSSAHFVTNARLENRGTIHHAGTHHVYLRKSGIVAETVLENHGSYELLENRQVTSDLGGGRFDNFGTVIKSEVSTTGGFGVALRNHGLVDLQGGRLNLAGGVNTGTLKVASGTEASFNSGTWEFNAGSVVEGDGKLVIDGEVTLNVPLTVATPVQVKSATLQLNAPLTTTAAFTITGGQVELAAGVDETLPNLDQLGGGIRVAGGTFQVTGLWNWSGAPSAGLHGVDGTGRFLVPAGATLNVQGGQGHFVTNARLENRGTIHHAGTHHVYLRKSGIVAETVLENHGSYELLENRQVTSDLGGGRFDNFGTVIKSEVSTTGGFGVALRNHGLVDLQGGRLNLAGGVNTGTLKVASGTEASFNSGTWEFNAGSVVEGDGKLVIDGEVTLNVPLTVATPVQVKSATLQLNAPLTTTAAFTISGGQVELAAGVDETLPNLDQLGGGIRVAGGTFQVTGLWNWSGAPSAGLHGVDGTGRFLVPAGATLNVQGGQGHFVTNARLENRGTIHHAGTHHVYLRKSGIAAETVLENHGLYELLENRQVTSDLGGGRFDNFGTVIKSEVSTTGGFGVALRNHGLVDLQGGRLNLAGGVNTGTLKVASGTEASFNSGTWEFNAGSVVEGDGKLVIDGEVTLNVPLTVATPVQVKSATLQLNAPLTTTAAFTITGGQVELAAGVDETLPNLDQLGGGIRVAGGTFQVTGLWNWSGAPSAGLHGVDGTGRFLVPAGATLNVQGGQGHFVTNARLENRGTIHHAGTHHVYLRKSGIAFDTLLNNHGTYELTVSGSITTDIGGGQFVNLGSFRRTGTGNTGGFGVPVVNTGTIELAAGTSSFTTITQNAGTFRQAGGESKGTKFNLVGGTLTGTGKMEAAVNNTGGLIAPGASPGFFQFTTFENGIDGILSVELSGGTAGVNYDQIRVTGAAKLAGTVSLALLPDYSPNLTDTFTVITASPRTGQFDTLINPAGAQYEATYLPASVILNPTSIDVSLPVVTVPPVSRTVVVNNPVEFGVTVTGSAPLEYHWQKNNKDLPGETGSTLKFNAVQLTDAGNYRVGVTNSFGGTASLPATLKVVPSAATPFPVGDTATSEALRGVAFQNTQVGAVVGDNGTIRFTRDGGLTWTVSDPGVPNHINTVFFIGGAAFIAGSNGLICVSYDLGRTWQQFATGTTAAFNGMYFTSPTLGFAVGDDGTICRYNGTAWELTPSNTTVDFYGVHGRGGTFWAVGAGGTICVYKNGGWLPQNSSVTEPTFRGVAFQSDTFGLVAGTGGIICVTRNGGATWTPVSSGSSADLRSVAFATATTLFVTGAGGTLLQSTDGGVNFAIGGGGGAAGFNQLSIRDGVGYYVDTSGVCHGFFINGVAVNQPPIVAITQPGEVAVSVTNIIDNVTNVVVIKQPYTNTTCVVLPFAVLSRDPDGTVARVELLADGASIAAVNGATELRIRWTNSVPRLVIFTALATDAKGAVGVSEPVRVMVVPPPVGTIVSLLREDGAFELCFHGTEGKTYEVEATSDFISWDNLGPMTLSDSLWHFVDPEVASHPHRFFHARETNP